MSNEDNTRLDDFQQNYLNPKNVRDGKASKKFNINDRTNSYNDDEEIRIIQSRCEFLKFGEVDTFMEQFKASVLIRSRWFDEEMIEEYDPEKHWNPHLYIQNLIPEKFFETVRYKCVRHENRTEIWEIRTCKGTFWERMELHDFPLDIQELSIVVESKHNPRYVHVIPDKERISRMSGADTLNSFRDQQKFKVSYLLVGVFCRGRSIKKVIGSGTFGSFICLKGLHKTELTQDIGTLKILGIRFRYWVYT